MAEAATSLRLNLRTAAALFLANGLAVGAFGGSLPGFARLLHLSHGDIALLLMTAGVSAVIGMNISGPVADRFGARVPALWGAGLLALGCVGIALAPSHPWMLAAAAIWGLGNGAMDIAMNAMGVWIEAQRHRPVMSRLHAMFSIGNFLGAGLVILIGQLVDRHDEARIPLLLAVVVAAALVAGTDRWSPREAREEHVAGGGRSRIPAVAWLLAVMAFCFGLSEGTAVDWSSLHITEVGGVSPSVGAIGLACVSGLMVLIRLAGDHVVSALGRTTVIRAGSAIALVGYLLVALTTPLALLLLGWCLVGLGVGLLGPQIYGMAGHLSAGRGLAVVVSFGYTAFLIGPALIGFLAREFGLQHAMLAPVVTALALIAMSAAVGRGVAASGERSSSSS